MKRILTFLFLVFLTKNSVAQFVDIMDSGFQNFLQSNYPACVSWNGTSAYLQLDTTCTDITTVDSLDIIWGGTDMRPLVYFDSLKYLRIDQGYVEMLALPAGIEKVIIRNQKKWVGWGTPGVNDIPSLLTLPPLPASLKYLDCSYNGIGGLGNLPIGLDTLICTYNTMALTDGPAGIVLVPALIGIQNLPAGLKYLKCNGNALTSLPALPASLRYLDCSGNRYYIGYDEYDHVDIYQGSGISSLPALPSSIEYISCAGNTITLPMQYPSSLLDLNVERLGDNTILPPALAFLDVAFVTCLPELPASMAGQSPYNTFPYNLVISETGPVTCVSNFVPGIRPGRKYFNSNSYYFLPWAAPLCNAVNNPNGCVSNPTITGNVFYDLNSNGTQDANEFSRDGVKLTDNSNGQVGFSDITGHYVVPGQLGNNIVHVEPPAFYNAVPASLNYDFSTIDTIVSASIALQPAVSADSVRITISPLDAARYGWEMKYNIKFENAGTTTVAPAITVHFNNSYLSYVSSYGSATVTNTTNTLNCSTGNIIPGQRSEFTAVFSVIGPMGSVINTSATSVAGTNTSSDTASSVVITSFDPNDKQATATLTEAQVQAGGEIDYLIRCQNTGTDTAFNIVLLDTLSPMLQANTLKILEASHACTVTQLNNIVAFEFRNIKLPYTGINEPASHGYVRFRIKPQTNLPLNTTVTNKASIYFDYNVPVITGDAITIVNLSAVPVKLNSFNVKKQNSVVQLYWSTEQEMNSKLFIVERSTDQRVWNEITRLNAAGNSSTLKNYSATDLHPAKGVDYYRLKQIDLDGKFNYSEIRSVYFGNETSIVLVPNPAVDKMTVYLPGNTTMVSVNIYNMNGQLLKQVMSNEEAVQVSLADFPKGIYSVRVNGKNLNEIRKLVVE